MWRSIYRTERETTLVNFWNVNQIKLMVPNSHGFPHFLEAKDNMFYLPLIWKFDCFVICLGHCLVRETNVHFLFDLLSFTELTQQEQQQRWKRWLWFIIRSFSGVMECLQSTIKHWSGSRARGDISYQQTSQQAWQPAYQWPSHICM